MHEEMQFISPCNGYEPFSVQLCGYSYCDGSYSIRRAISGVTCVEFIIHGQGTIHTKGRTFHPKKGDFYILHQGDDHYYYSDKDNPWTKVWFNITGELVPKLVSEYGLQNINHVENIPLLPLFEEMVELSRENLSSEEICDRALVIFIKILQKVSRRVKSEGTLISPEAIALKDYIHRNIEKNINSAELSAIIERSPSQMSRIFKKAFSLTPCEYIIRLKIATAQQLLVNTNMRITDISTHMGFADEHYFSKCFRQKVGMSPRQYRASRVII